jgi:predicted HicB family RNase H-like nuclease
MRKATLGYKGYLGTVEPDTGSYFGRVVGLRDVITFEGETYKEVTQAFRDSIDDYLDFCVERGEQPDRTFNDKIPLSVPPEFHPRAWARAPAEGLSVHHWIAKRIESAK